VTQTSQSQLLWRESDEGLRPVLVEGKRETVVAWAPQPGSQEAFLSCPVFECLLEGNRGGGKTDALIMSYGQFTGAGFGAEWRGILFRRTYPQLRDVIDKCLKWIPMIWPRATYNRSEYYWTWPDGEQLFLRHLNDENDYWNYHGHNYPWQGFEELCTWPDDKAYTKLFACARSTAKGIPIMVRSTANPYGVGHNWVKARFKLPIAGNRTKGPVLRGMVDKYGDVIPERVAVHSHLGENRVLMSVDKEYLSRIKAAARNDAEYQAWVHGNWDIVAGGMFDDVWDPRVHIVPNFPLAQIPRNWHINRSYDHGQSKPFSVGWWAQSNGEPFKYRGHVYGTVPGDLYRINEWYGWNGEPNEGLRLSARDIAKGIILRESAMGLTGRVRRGPADTQIFDPNPGYPSTAEDMATEGVHWDWADKSPGSRKQGWEAMRTMLKAANEHPREYPGLFVLEQCEQFRRTVPVLPRSDFDLDDVNTETEDHIGDETRYRLRHKRIAVSSGVWK
jgi:hypothetical protein